jgi:hypothetical protein
MLLTPQQAANLGQERDAAEVKEFRPNLARAIEESGGKEFVICDDELPTRPNSRQTLLQELIEAGWQWRSNFVRGVGFDGIIVKPKSH